ncbi:MAG TPA: hypothetical protein VFQ44_17810 [Streptosporangiaceae bacterium]|nr:hypothetical protein [Streptosporangiaceae bacterium]
MPTTLRETVLAPEVKPEVIDDCLALIDQQVSEMSGASGTAVKVAYKTAAAFASGYMRTTVTHVLPDLVDALEPFWADFGVSGGSDFGDYLAKRGDEVSQALLGVSDDRAARSQRPVIIRAYQSVRAHAARHVQAALPQVGNLAEKYAARP